MVLPFQDTDLDPDDGAMLCDAVHASHIETFHQGWAAGRLALLELHLYPTPSCHLQENANALHVGVGFGGFVLIRAYYQRNLEV